MKNRCCLAVILALVSLLAGCNSKNEPDEKSLGRLISTALEQKPGCIYLGQMPYKMTDSGPPTGYDALTRVGLLERSQVSQPVGTGLLGKPIYSHERVYQLTPQGQKFYSNAKELCYASLELVEVKRFSARAQALGKVITQVTYSYKAKSVADWALNDDVQRSYYFLRLSVASYRTPIETTAVLSQASDGWHIETLGLKE
jgi:hypothetical protein